MNAHKLIAVVMAVLLLTAGAAAATPGESPTNDGTETADEHQPTETGDDATDEDENATDADENATDADVAADDNETDADVAADAEDDESDERDENASEGPPTDMPEQVPDHVTAIHQLIRDKLNGDLGNTTLGEAISGVVGGNGDAADEQSENADEQSESASDNADEQSDNADEASENGQSENANASVVGDLPEQAADQVSAIHDAITSFLNGDGDGNPGDEVSGTASG